MHNIPVFVLAGLLAIGWKREIVGAAAFFGAGLLYIGLTIFSARYNGLPWYIAASWSLTLGVPALFIGFLFLLNWRKRRSHNEMDWRDRV